MGLLETLLALVLASSSSERIQERGAIETTRAELRAAADALRGAAARGEAGTVAGFFTPEFLWVHSTGGVDTRDDYVAKLLADDPRAAPPLQRLNETLELLGRDAALLRWEQPSPVIAGARLFGSALYVKRGGVWQAVLMQGTLLSPIQPSIPQGSEDMDRLVGVYVTAEGNRIQVKRHGTRLLLLRPARPIVILLAQSAHEFVVKGGQAKLSFVIEGQRPADQLLLTQPDGRLEIGYRTKQPPRQ